jgi:hypothetical protein
LYNGVTFEARRCPMENKESAPSIEEHFSVLEDPRRYNRWHYLRDILLIAICAALGGADGWSDVALFGKAKLKWLKEVLGLELPHGIPSPDTFRRVFAVLLRNQLKIGQPSRKLQEPV